MSELISSFTRWRDALSPRERIGLAVVALCAALIAAVQAFEGYQDSRARVGEAALALTQEQAVRLQLEDDRVRALIERRAAQVRQWSIAAETPDAAELQAAAIVEDIAELSGLTNASVTLRPRDDQAGTTIATAIRLDVQADYDPRALAAFLAALAREDVDFAVTGLEGRAPDTVNDAMTRVELRAVALRDADAPS
ncbi:MAG: hypothetical protein GC189_02370 [Alphaproteobacteria bacterium]|nr:hypothetical protein [Alphaproteobacteria bacterium]